MAWACHFWPDLGGFTRQEVCRVEFGHILEYVFAVLGGALIGIAVLGQFFVNASVGEVARYDSTKRKVVAYSIRIGAAIISLAVLILVIRMLRSSTTVTVFSALAIAAGLLTTIVFGWKKLIRKRAKIKGARLE